MVSMPFRPRSRTPRQATGLALEMEAQRQLVHVIEGHDGETAHRVHRHLGEQAVAQLRQQRHQNAHAAVRHRHDDGNRRHPGQPGAARHRLASESIGRPFEGERHRYGGELGGEQHHHRPYHPHLQVVAVGRPDVRPQIDQGLEQRSAFRRDFTFLGVQRADVGIGH